MAGYSEIALGQASNNNLGGAIHSGARIIPFNINRTNSIQNHYITTVPIEDYHVCILECIISPALGDTSSNVAGGSIVLTTGGAPRYIKDITAWSKITHLAPDVVLFINSYIGISRTSVTATPSFGPDNNGKPILYTSNPTVNNTFDRTLYSETEVDITLSLTSLGPALIRGTITLI